MAAPCRSRPECTPAPQGMTDREENVVRYVAGYMLMKLKKKHHQYAAVLITMKTSLDEDKSSIQSLQDYSCTWTEQRDRGGLYHVSNNFSLMKAIELICRHHLDITMDPSEDVLSKIEEQFVKTKSVVSSWKTMTTSLVLLSQSSNLLKSVTRLYNTNPFICSSMV